VRRELAGRVPARARGEGRRLHDAPARDGGDLDPDRALPLAPAGRAAVGLEAGADVDAGDRRNPLTRYLLSDRPTWPPKMLRARSTACTRPPGSTSTIAMKSRPKMIRWKSTQRTARYSFSVT